ncbi:hypothetical protein Hanom_Chr00s000006g01614511 [Helianthus anomalus]
MYILKILATTVVARRSGENKANWLDLFALMCMVEKRNWNLVSFFAWSWIFLLFRHISRDLAEA